MENIEENISELIYEIETEGLEETAELIAAITSNGISYQVHLKIIKSSSNDFIDWEDNVPHFKNSDGQLIKQL